MRIQASIIVWPDGENSPATAEMLVEMEQAMNNAKSFRYQVTRRGEVVNGHFDNVERIDEHGPERLVAMVLRKHFSI